MVFTRVELPIKNVVEQTHEQTRLKLPHAAGVVGGKGVLESVEKGEPHRHGNRNEENLGEQGLEEFCSFYADDRATEQKCKEAAEVQAQQKNVSFLYRAAVKECPVSQDHRRQPEGCFPAGTRVDYLKPTE